MKKVCLSILCLMVMIVVIFVCYVASIVPGFLEKSQPVNNAVEESIQGLPIGQKLSTKPTSITDDYVYFTDRVLECFHYHEESAQIGSEAIAQVMNSLPEQVNKYLLIVPMRIATEEINGQVNSDNIQSAIEEIYSKMPSTVESINMSNVFQEHKGEYLFFRTDSKWTALGAYYAAEELSKLMKIQLMDIHDYKEMRFTAYSGTYRSLPNTESLSDYNDYVSYYLKDSLENSQLITVRESEGVYNTYQSPAVALSRRGTDIFVGGYFSHSILQGEAKNNKVMLIVGDNNAKIFTPWMIPYYEKVIIINPLFFNHKDQSIKSFMVDYPITDFLILESINTVMDTSYSNRLISIIQNE